jgi:mannose-6-phosphate isomerase-like protein (cupin superfamily)
MTTKIPSAVEYAAESAAHPALTIVDVMAEQAAVSEPYRNQVLVDVNDGCVRLAVFEEEYRWHHHPESDELFLVVQGNLEIDLADGRCLSLAPWQCVVIPAGAVHRTRAIGRTVNLTLERQHARTVFDD